MMPPTCGRTSALSEAEVRPVRVLNTASGWLWSVTTPTSWTALCCAGGVALSQPVHANNATTVVFINFIIFSRRVKGLPVDNQRAAG